MDTSRRTGNDRHTGQFENQRTLTVVGNRETVENQVVQQTGIQCYNCKGFRHSAKECRKPKRVKDYEYHKEKMMLCKQESKGIPLSVEQNEWLQDTDEEPDEQELEAHYIQHSEQPESINDTYVVEKVDSNVILDLSDMCDNEEKADQNTDKRVLIASLIANLKLDVDEKKIQKQLKKANTSLTQELDKYKLDLKYCKIDLERYKFFQTNQKDKEASELKCKEALDLLTSDTHKNNESSKTEAYRTFLVKEENAKLVNQISMQERQIAKIANEEEQLKKDFKEREDKDIDKQITLENQVKTLNVQANVNNIKSIVDTEWRERKQDWYKPVTDDIRLFEKLLIPVAHKAVKNVALFENALKEEMFEDFKYVKSVKKEVDVLKIEIDDLKSQLKNAKTDFLKIDDMLLQEFPEKDILCVTYMFMIDSENYCDMKCKYLDTIRECERIEFELSKQKEILKNKPTHLLKQYLESENIYLK
ncbi:hypothetical protein Tco_1337125 [Tanacetum coccineum]